MNFNFAAIRGFRARLRKTLLFAMILINLLATQIYGQTNFTRNQFSRFPLLTRAAYFENEILNAANREGVDPNVLWTIAYNETRFRPWLTSPKNAQGLMQFIPSTAARYNLTNPYEAVSAIRAAARYVKYLSNLFGGRIDSILAAYNSGEGTVSAFIYGRTIRTERKIINPKGIKTIGGVPPYAETIAYVGRGLKIYRWLILRGTFPSNIARAVFPTVISATVARMSLIDYELGKIPDFKTSVFIPQTVAQVPAGTEIVKETTESKSEQNSQTNNLAEIYYDSRSGNRYAVRNGNQTKLDENGVVVINNNSRPSTTKKARSTFFAAPSK
jgi:hypothetical protein